MNKLACIAAIAIALFLGGCDDSFNDEVNNLIHDAASLGYTCAKAGMTRDQMHKEVQNAIFRAENRITK